MTFQQTFRSPRSLVAVAASATLILASLPLATVAAERPPDMAARLAPPHAQDRVIVVYEPGATGQQRVRSLRSLGLASVDPISPRAPRTVVLELEAGQTVAQAIAELESQPAVAYAGPDYWLQAAATSNDPYFTNGSHWGMYGDASSPQAVFGSGAAEAWTAGHTGSDTVYVGIIDEGLQVDHPDLAQNAWTNPFDPVDGIDNDGNGYVDDVHGWDFVNDDSSVYDGPSDAHGTHVAGTVGARGGNGLGVAGVNWNVQLISGKFLDPVDGGLTSDAIRALDYMTDLKLRHGLDIVATNNSYGGAGSSPPMLDAIERAGDAGILFVAAAGNNGLDLDSSPRYPAAYDCDRKADGSVRGWDCLVAVANLRSDGKLNTSSNYSDNEVHLGAPGTGIISTVPYGNGYDSYTGTSMAAPHVTGAIALCYSADPTQTARQLRSRLLSSAKATSSLSGITTTGDRLDIGALLETCAPTPTPTPTPAPTPTP
ncbi:MAG: S8 family peptidase, partial [Candidatus Limnocylindrales bacterium]